MSYDIYIHVRVAGTQNIDADRYGQAPIYAKIAEPELHSPTYNLGEMFRACMDWDYSQCEKDQDGKYQTVYYRCDEVIEHVQHGLRELRTNRRKYEKYNPQNGWGNLDSAVRVLESLRQCIYECAERIPLECLWMSW